MREEPRDDTHAFSFVPFAYRLSFLTGLRVKRLLRGVRRALRAVFDVALAELAAKTVAAARRGSDFLRSQAGRGELSPTRGLVRAGQGAAQLLASCRCALAEGGLRAGAPVCAHILGAGARRFFAARRPALNFIAPVLSVAALALTVAFWKNACFALAVTYNGSPLGAVGAEQTYRDAVTQVEGNVSDASGSNFRLTGTAAFRLVLTSRSSVSSQDQLYNKLVALSCNGVKNGYGLYVDDRLAGANGDASAVQAMLTGLTSSYRSDPSVQSVSFLQDVSIRTGVFPESVFKTIPELKAEVTDKNGGEELAARVDVDPLFAMNLTDGASLGQGDASYVSSDPVISVKVVKNEIVNKAIPYTVVKKQSAKLKSGTTKVSVQGKAGAMRVVQSVTYVDGTATDTDVLSSDVVAQPVTQTVLVGTKQESSSSGSAGDSGSSGNSASWASPYGNSVLSLAESALGVPYVSGGTSYGGFDCSGLTSYVYRRLGVYLPHSAAAQSAYGSYVSRSGLQAGDLVFFDTNGGHNNITHVGIYIGGGRFIDASSSRPHAVTVDSLYSSYYSKRYMTARRVK